jgi:hypothetical protein
MVFQCSKVHDVDGNTYPIISRYRYFSIKRHEINRHLSELVSVSFQMKLCCFFFLDIFFMRELNLLYYFLYHRKRPCTWNNDKEAEENFI